MILFHKLILRNILTLALFMTMAMASTDITEFFPDIHGNLTKITWAHAVNNQSELKTALEDENIMMLEADVVIGTIINSTDKTKIPIMGHPPNTESDLSLLDFLTKIDKFNANDTNTKKKGIKLDFKSIEAFLQSVSTIQTYDKGLYPIWINADILPGPINSTTKPVDANQFFKGTKSFPNSTLSIGWTTNYGSNYSGSYDSEQMSNMIDSIKRNNVTQGITFPVRAGLAAESIRLLVDLLDVIKGSTLTIWSSEGDNVHVDHLRELIVKVGITKMYIDVPSDLRDKLHLDNLPNSAAKFGYGILGIMIPILLCFFNFWRI